jgi:hypothetical protein
MIQSTFALLADIFRNTKTRGVLIGGYAVNAHKVTRHTVDIDFLVTKETFRNIFPELKQQGYSIVCEHEVFVQIAGKNLRDIDFMFSDESTVKKIFDTGDSIKIAGETFVTPNLENLIAMKLHSMRWNPHRELVDLPDIVFLIQANEIDVGTPEIRSLFLKYGTNELFEKIKTYLKQ